MNKPRPRLDHRPKPSAISKTELATIAELLHYGLERKTDWKTTMRMLGRWLYERGLDYQECVKLTSRITLFGLEETPLSEKEILAGLRACARVARVPVV